MRRRILLFEEQEIWREVLRTWLSQNPSFELVEAMDIRTEEGRREIERLKPELLLLGVKTLSGEATEAILEIAERLPQSGIVLLFYQFDPKGIEGLRRALHKVRRFACLRKDSLNSFEDLLRAINGVLAGYIELDQDLLHMVVDRKASALLEELTPREKEILKLMAEGYKNRAIADILNLEVKTVEHYVNSIFSKLGIDHLESFHPRVKAILTYLEIEGKLSPSPPT